MEIIRLEEKIVAGYRHGYDEALELMLHDVPRGVATNWPIA